MRRDSHVPPLQPLYNGPYAILRCSLHHFTLRIGDKEDNVSTLWLKPCINPTAPPAQPRVRGCPPAAVRFRDFPPPGAAAACRVHFAPAAASRTAPGTIFPWPAARSFCTPRHRSQPCRSAHPQPPSTVQIRPLGLHPRRLGGALWRLRDDLRGHRSLLGIPIIYCAHAISAHASGGPHTCQTSR